MDKCGWSKINVVLFHGKLITIQVSRCSGWWKIISAVEGRGRLVKKYRRKEPEFSAWHPREKHQQEAIMSPPGWPHVTPPSPVRTPCLSPLLPYQSVALLTFNSLWLWTFVNSGEFLRGQRREDRWGRGPGLLLAKHLYVYMCVSTSHMPCPKCACFKAMRWNCSN